MNKDPIADRNREIERALLEIKPREPKPSLALTKDETKKMKEWFLQQAIKAKSLKPIGVIPGIQVAKMVNEMKKHSQPPKGPIQITGWKWGEPNGEWKKMTSDPRWPQLQALISERTKRHIFFDFFGEN